MNTIMSKQVIYWPNSWPEEEAGDLDNR